MKLLALLLLFAVHTAALAQVGAAPTVPTSQERKVSEHRRKVSVAAKPKAILPAQKDLVSTAQSGASRSGKIPTTMPPLNTSGTQPTTSASTVVASANAQKGHWLLLYRTPNCIPCDRLMNALSSTEASSTPAMQQLTIVMGHPRPAMLPHAAHQAAPRAQATKANSSVATSAAQQGELNALRSKYPALNNATWTYDSAGTTAASLKPPGAPMMYGMDGSHIVWQSAGMPGGPAATQQRIASWLASKSTADIVAAITASATSARP